MKDDDVQDQGGTDVQAQSIRRIDKVLNAEVREFFWSADRIDEGVLQWFGHIERMENDRNAKRMYVGEQVGSCSVDWPLKRWINSVNDWLKKKKRFVCQASKENVV